MLSVSLINSQFNSDLNSSLMTFEEVSRVSFWFKVFIALVNSLSNVVLVFFTPLIGLSYSKFQ